MVDATTPLLRLDRAAELAFPNGGMTGRGLARLANRKKPPRLVVYRINNKLYTTLSDKSDMVARSRIGGIPAYPDGEKNAPAAFSEARDSVARAKTAIDELTRPPARDRRGRRS
jgi:hypothetical protein